MTEDARPLTSTESLASVFNREPTRRQVLKGSLLGGATLISVPALAAFLDACGATSTPAGQKGAIQITIGQDAQLTGGEMAYGSECKRGVAIATAAVNKAGKYAFTVNLLDDMSTVNQSVLNIQKFLSQNLNIIFGPQTSQESDAASPLVGAAGKLQFTINLDPNYPKQNKYGFAMAPTGQSQGVYAAQFAATKHLSRAATITENSAVGMELLQGFTGAAAANSLTVVDSEQYSVGNTQFGAQAGKIVGSHPDYVIIASTAPTEPALIAIALRAAGLPSSTVIADYNAVHNSTYLQLGKKAVEGVICFDEAAASTPYTQQANSVYQAAYGTLPVFPPVSMAYYDAVNWLVEAFDATGTTTDVPKLAAWIAGQKTLTTYFGDASFVDGRMSWPQHPFQVQNGAWVPYTG